MHVALGRAVDGAPPSHAAAPSWGGGAKVLCEWRIIARYKHTQTESAPRIIFEL